MFDALPNCAALLGYWTTCILVACCFTLTYLQCSLNNLRYGDDTTLMAGSEEELKSLLMKIKRESEKAGAKLNIQKTKIITSDPTTSWQLNGEKAETVMDFLGLQNHCRQ